MRGFSSRWTAILAPTTCSTIDCTSELPSFIFVCPSNCGSGTFTLTTAVIPSRKSSPAGVWFFLRRFSRFA